MRLIPPGPQRRSSEMLRGSHGTAPASSAHRWKSALRGALGPNPPPSWRRTASPRSIAHGLGLRPVSSAVGFPATLRVAGQVWRLAIRRLKEAGPSLEASGLLVVISAPASSGGLLRSLARGAPATLRPRGADSGSLRFPGRPFRYAEGLSHGRGSPSGATPALLLLSVSGSPSSRACFARAYYALALRAPILFSPRPHRPALATRAPATRLLCARPHPQRPVPFTYQHTVRSGLRGSAALGVLTPIGQSLTSPPSRSLPYPRTRIRNAPFLYVVGPCPASGPPRLLPALPSLRSVIQSLGSAWARVALWCSLYHFAAVGGLPAPVAYLPGAGISSLAGLSAGSLAGSVDAGAASTPPAASLLGDFPKDSQQLGDAPKPRSAPTARPSLLHGRPQFAPLRFRGAPLGFSARFALPGSRGSGPPGLPGVVQSRVR